MTDHNSNVKALKGYLGILERELTDEETERRIQIKKFSILMKRINIYEEIDIDIEIDIDMFHVNQAAEINFHFPTEQTFIMRNIIHAFYKKTKQFYFNISTAIIGV